MCRNRQHRAGAPRPQEVSHQDHSTVDSKYIGSFNTHTECVAFVKGVEAVLNYMLEAKDVKGLKSVLDHTLEAKEFEIPAKLAK
jgi:hypothetical protein